MHFRRQRHAARCFWATKHCSVLSSAQSWKSVLLGMVLGMLMILPRYCKAIALPCAMFWQGRLASCAFRTHATAVPQPKEWAPVAATIRGEQESNLYGSRSDPLPRPPHSALPTNSMQCGCGVASARVRNARRGSPTGSTRVGLTPPRCGNGRVGVSLDTEYSPSPVGRKAHFGIPLADVQSPPSVSPIPPGRAMSK